MFPSERSLNFDTDPAYRVVKKKNMVIMVKLLSHAMRAILINTDLSRSAAK